MTFSVVLDHLIISLVGGGLGLIAGGMLGYMLGLVARLVLATPAMRRISILIPWRTVILGLMMLVWTPGFVLLYGIGVKTGSASTGLVMFFLALPFTATVLLDQRYPSSSVVRFVAEARTLATASFVIATAAGLNGGGGIGDLYMRELTGFRISALPLTWLVLVVLILVIDLLFGILQFSVFKVHS